MPQYLAEVEAEALPSKGWKPAAVQHVYYNAIGSGDNIGGPRISLQMVITAGRWEGESVFLSGGLTGKYARIIMRQLGTIQPNVDWRAFDWPTPPKVGAAKLKDPEELAEPLIGQECWIKIDHRMYEGSLTPDVKGVAGEDAGLELDETSDED